MSDGGNDALVERLLAALDRNERTPLPSAEPGGLALERAFVVAQALARRRVARGERRRGWKIGFTNRSIWERYGVYAPIWGRCGTAPRSCSTARRRRSRWPA
jgi:2-keto-4-pentenoate hydratase